MADPIPHPISTAHTGSRHVDLGSSIGIGHRHPRFARYIISGFSRERVQRARERERRVLHSTSQTDRDSDSRHAPSGLRAIAPSAKINGLWAFAYPSLTGYARGAAVRRSPFAFPSGGMSGGLAGSRLSRSRSRLSRSRVSARANFDVQIAQNMVSTFTPSRVTILHFAHPVASRPLRASRPLSAAPMSSRYRPIYKTLTSGLRPRGLTRE
jgi:hypothetical protein